MRITPRTLVGALLAAAAALGTAALSRVPYPAAGAETALVRLSWRARSERVEECRRLSAQEMEALPVHMRRSEVCEGRVLPYRLRVLLDGVVLRDDTIHAAGAREDRPLYVFQEVAVEPGTHEIRVSFVRLGKIEDGDEEEHEEEHEEEGRSPRTATPARLELDARVELRPGDVTLVTYDADRRALVARLPSGSE